MKKFATLTAMAFLLATAGAFATTPSTAADKAPAKPAKTAKVHRAHKKVGAKPGTPTPTPAQK